MMELDYTQLRAQMVRGQLLPQGITCPRVLLAFAKVKKECFSDEQSKPLAYAECTHQQTMSTPHLAQSLQMLNIKPKDKVLIIGVGYGYVVALLQELASFVVGLEPDAERYDRAKKNLERLGYAVEHLHQVAGDYGFLEFAPYDRVLVMQPLAELSEALINQISEDGRCFFIKRFGKHYQTMIASKSHEGLSIRPGFITGF